MEYERIKSVKKIDDLIQLGSETEVKRIIEDIIHPIAIKADTYEELYKITIQLRKKWVDLLDGPFISKQDEYIFYLTKLEGKQRNRNLGITDNLYENKELAKKWYSKIAKYVHPDKCFNKDKDGAAFKVLSELYKVMIED